MVNWSIILYFIVFTLALSHSVKAWSHQGLSCQSSNKTKSTKTYNKSGAYDTCTIFQVLWSHTIDLCEKQTERKNVFSVVILKPCFLIHTWGGEMASKYDVSW